MSFFLPSLTSPLRFSQLQNSLDAQINRMRRSITVSPHFSRKGKEPVRKESQQFVTEVSVNSNTTQESTEASFDTENADLSNDNAQEESTHLETNSQESVMPYSDAIEGDVTSDCPLTKRKRGNTSRKATQSKKKPKQGSYGSMEQFVFRINKN
ncbi:hypothetical protein A0J61_11516 [Choanephora cucurbitarum]|uniref:Uncharacterized protein n=1 Tax=Choanephora cucurbitarum TaxID=101091 RepID=A0A1C7MU77_9FUNG|nr:hypothetical protein A0J61_11516 [Choanephora cucurbitarum]